MTPLPPPPRRVRRAPGGTGESWFGRIFILPHTLIGIGALGYLIFLLFWWAFGADIPGVATGTEVSHSSKGGTSYLLKYRYEVDKETKSGSDGVKQPIYERFQSKDEANTPVTVHYFALGPLEHAKLREGGTLWTEIGFLTLWAGFWNTVVFVALYQLWVVPLRVRWLYKHGEATTGTLTGKRVKTGKSSNYYVSYTFREAMSGQLIEAEDQVWNVPLWNHAVAGQPVTVLYAPGNPKRSTVYELGGYGVQADNPLR